MAWIYLFVASLFEIAWTYSLKFMDMKKIGAIRWLQFFNSTDGIVTLAPLLGYIVFGLANIYCFSVSLKTIPTATAIAVWMGVVLVGTKLIDMLYFKQAFSYSQFIFISFILVGIVGLKAGK